MITFRLWQWVNTFWNKNRRWILDVILILALIVLAIVIYIMATPAKFPYWTGIEPYTDPKGEFHPGITLWDWFGLLIIPAVLAIGAYWFNRQERATDRQIAKDRTDLEREIAEKRFQDELLQDYLDKMTELLLDKNLRNSEEGSEVRSVARSRTLTVLRLLDGERKGQVIRFLSESELVTSEMPQPESQKQKTLPPIIDLSVADLVKAELGGVRLFGTDLGGADLRGSDLREADLQWSDLKGANIRDASLSGVNLKWSNLVGADFGLVDLRWANLGRADLNGAKFVQANLVAANLKGANLVGTDLEEANLEAANLEDANLEGANLLDAKITEGQLMQAKSLLNAILPDSTIWKERKYTPRD